VSDEPPPADPPRHRRRPRYRGTHPRRFEQKYKELDPERFPDEAEKAVERGGTPAGSHIPVMPDEIVAALEPAPGGVLLDCTLGHGGHTEILARSVLPGGRVIGLDRDAEELARTAERLAGLGLPIVTRHVNYSGAAGPLDLRMDRSRGETAEAWLAAADEQKLEETLRVHGDEPDAAAIAHAINARCAGGTALTTTADLVAIVLAAKGLPGPRFRRPDPYTPHPAARTFQALRMVINRETEHLAALLRDLPWIVRPGARVAFLTFHEGEERPVVAALRAGAKQGLWSTLSEDPQRPTREETRRNPRSRSARLWTAVRAPF